MQVESHLPLKELKQLERAEKDAGRSKRLRIVILALGVATAAATALSPETDYQRFRGKARAYEELWRNVWAYTTIELPTASSRAEIDAAVQRFTASSRAVGSP